MRIDRKRFVIAGGLIVVAATVIAVALARRSAPGADAAAADPHAGHVADAKEVWTCPMHPEVRLPGPGKCPKCGMDLVKASPDAAPAPAGTPRAGIQLDTRRRQLIGVRTVRVERGPIERTIRTVGLVRYDETRLADVNLKLDGWVRQLHVDYTGQPIRRGQPLLDLYSPELLATQNEYLLALATRESMRQSTIPEARAQADRLVESARQRLALWDLSAEDIARLDRTNKAEATVTFRSPVTGFVIEKPVVEGMRVTAGQTLYKVADLSTVWVEADVYESDAPFVKVGMPAGVTVDARPGEVRRGRAIYIYPYVEEKTRTLKVRLAFANPGVLLKPGMYANVELQASLGTALTLPSDAVLDAGREQLVFVAEGDGYYQPRDVRVGQRLDGRVQILDGLQEGEQVAAGAAFFLDSESQMRAAAGRWEAAAPPPAAGAAEASASVSASIDFRTQPDPPRTGENAFEARVTDASGQPIADAQVAVVFYMPAMPSMNMPAMTAQTRLVHAGNGVYRGTGLLSMAGRWDVTVTVTRDGRRLASTHATVMVR